MSPKSKTVTHKVTAATPFEAVFNLNLADSIPPCLNSRFLFIYSTENEERSPEEFRPSLVERLIGGLSSFLEQTPSSDDLAFPQLLGRLHYEPGNGRMAVKITKTSHIPFVVATHDEIDFQNLQPDQGFPAAALPGKIFSTGIDHVAKFDRSGSTQGFSVQLTFVNGGFVVCVHKNDNLLDVYALGHLVRWWFQRSRSLLWQDELARLDIEEQRGALDIHDQTSLVEFKEVPQQQHPEWRTSESNNTHIYGLEMPAPGAFAMARHLFHRLPHSVNSNFYISPTSLRQLQTTVRAKVPAPISLRDAVFALIWRCMTRARLGSGKQASAPPPSPSHPNHHGQDDGVQTTMLALPLDGRRILDPALARQYFGNATFYSPVIMPLPALLGNSGMNLAELATAIREGVRTTQTNTHLRSMLQLMANQPKATSLVTAFKLAGGYDVCICNWEAAFGDLEDMFLGCGDFQTIRLPNDAAFEGIARIMPAFGQRDTFGLEISVDLSPEHMTILKQDFEWKHYAECMEWE